MKFLRAFLIFTLISASLAFVLNGVFVIIVIMPLVSAVSGSVGAGLGTGLACGWFWASHA
jgi:hypothetical protein